MRLYLSSVGIPNHKELLALMPAHDNKKAALIPNAWDVFPQEQRKSEVGKLRVSFGALGFDVMVIDLNEHQGDDLRQALSGRSLLWLMGGNTFYLNHLVRQSGLDGFMDDLLEQGLVYGGESAGAVLAGTTLRGVQNLDDPAVAAEVIWEGLNLVDFGIVPHYGMEQYAGELEKCKVEMEKYSRVVTISNDQAIVVNDGSVKVVEKER